MEETEHLGFEDLDVYKYVRLLCKQTYSLINSFPAIEKYALSDQLRRSITSVGSNIAEGYGRFSTKEKIHFLSIANGSLYESYFQLQLALDFDYITQDDFSAIRNDIYRVSRMINGLKNFYEKQTPNT